MRVCRGIYIMSDWVSVCVCVCAWNFLLSFSFLIVNQNFLNYNFLDLFFIYLFIFWIKK